VATRKEQIDVTVTGTSKGAAELGRMARAVDDVGDELKGAAKDATVLDRELSRLERTSAELNREFARTGDKGLLKQLKDTRRELAPLQAVRRELDKIAVAEGKARKDHDRDAAESLRRMTTPGGGARGSVGGLSLPINSTTLAIGGVLGAGLSLPALAGAGGAIIAGGAGLGVGAGIAGAATSDPRIGSAFGAAVGDETKRWQAASKSFVDPTLNAIKMLKAAAEDIPLEEILENASEMVEPLAEGIAGLISESGKGLGELVANAGPVIEVLSEQLPLLGSSLKAMFAEIGEGSEGGAAALEDIFEVVSRIIIGTGKLIHFFEDVYEAGVKLREALPGDMWSDDEEKIIGFGQAIAGVAQTMGATGEATAAATENLESFEDTLHRLIGLPLDLAEANAEFEAAIDSLTESIQANTGAWDEGTAAGRENNAAVREAIQKAFAYRDAQVASGVQTGVANRQLDASIARLRAQAVAAGADAAAFDRLTGAARNYMATPSVKVITTRFVTEGSAPRAAIPGRQIAFAAGGTFGPGVALVGEEGPELVRFNGGGRVFSNTDSKSMARSLGGAAGGGVMRAELVAGAGGNSAVAEMIRYLVRVGDLQLKVVGDRVAV
jgi:hypothetical protein